MATLIGWCVIPAMEAELPLHFHFPPSRDSVPPQIGSSVTRSFVPYAFKELAPRFRLQIRRHKSRTLFALNTGDGASDSSRIENLKSGDDTALGSTRLGTIVQASTKQLLEKLNSARRNFPMKIFLLLLGFYTANALATILGQTGDWDVLVAGVVVAAIEGIGMLMYKKPFSMPVVGRIQSLVVMVNYWKAGVCLGLFVDAFKLGS